MPDLDISEKRESRQSRDLVINEDWLLQLWMIRSNAVADEAEGHRMVIGDKTVIEI